MAKHLWRILLITLCGCPITLPLSQALRHWAVATGVVSPLSLTGSVVHELPFLITVLPLVVATTALMYVGCCLVWRGRVGLPDHPRAVTWLILADFVSPIWLIAISLSHYVGR